LGWSGLAAAALRMAGVAGLNENHSHLIVA
jgi:hypothetical protein